jgi:hypothetical protein
MYPPSSSIAVWRKGLKNPINVMHMTDKHIVAAAKWIVKSIIQGRFGLHENQALFGYSPGGWINIFDQEMMFRRYKAKQQAQAQVQKQEYLVPANQINNDDVVYTIPNRYYKIVSINNQLYQIPCNDVGDILANAKVRPCDQNQRFWIKEHDHA